MATRKNTPKAAAASAGRKTTTKRQDGDLIRQSKVRSTGVLVTLHYRPSLDAANPFVLTCTEHGTTKAFPTWTLAQPFMPKPEEWCPACKRALTKAEVKPEAKVEAKSGSPYGKSAAPKAGSTSPGAVRAAAKKRERAAADEQVAAELASVDVDAAIVAAGEVA
jgi:hypothetical protein